MAKSEQTFWSVKILMKLKLNWAYSEFKMVLKFLKLLTKYAHAIKLMTIK